MKTFSRNILFLFVFFLCSTSVQAQVKNYCVQLSPEGSINCGPMPELDTLKNFTVQFWMNADEWTNGATILSRGNSLRVQTTTAKALRITAAGKSVSVSNAALVAGSWVHVMFIGSATRMRVFINGKTALTERNDFTLPVDDEPFVIGGGFSGRIDELRVWNAELAADYDYFVNNTLNKWVPQLKNLVAYYKFDQNLCPNIVDYKALFSPSTYNHHGIKSESGVARKVVTDNRGLPYLLNGGYVDDKRFFDTPMSRDLFLLANDIIILGADIYESGHVYPTVPNDHATLSNAQYLPEYQGRSGVLSLRGTATSRLICPTTVMEERGEYTFETWIYLEKWTEGAYIFRRETDDKQKGFSISLGKEDTRQVIVRVNGKQFISTNSLTVGRWMHFAVTTNNGGTVKNTFLFTYNGAEKWAATNISDNSTNTTPTGMANCKAYIGEKLTAKLDQTIFWRNRHTSSELRSHMNGDVPFASLSSRIGLWDHTGIAYYKYDMSSRPGHDSFSQDELRFIVDEAYKGHRGYQVRLSVMGANWAGGGQSFNWINVIADPEKRKIFAADLAQISECYDGVELDLEWMDGLQTNLGLLGDEIMKALPKGKTLMISHHQYGAYQYPKDKIASVDGFTFQQYGNQQNWFTYSSFVNGYNAFRNYGYPDDKIYLSYSTTTSFGYDKNGERAADIAGVGWGLMDGNYKPATDGSAEARKFNGNTFYFTGPVQVYNRAKFCVEKNVKGIFYWDMANDVPPTHRHCLSKACNYGLSSNVDTLVTEVEVNHVVTAIDRVSNDNALQQVQIQFNQQTQTVSAAAPQNEQIRGMELYTTSGANIRSANGAVMSTAVLPAGVYVVKVKLSSGRDVSPSFVKR